MLTLNRKIRRVNGKVAKLMGNDRNINKNSIEYWHNLKEKGAITAEEYEVKKKELLN